MRADRLISILLLLQVHRRMTARELAHRLEVSERTVHRDMESLSMAGIPVYAERGVGGGWALVDEYRTNLTGLKREEIQALFLAGPHQLLADLGLEEASNAAMMKLLAAIPSTNRGDAEYARQRIHIDVTGWHRADEAVTHLPLIQQAVWQERKLEITYDRGECDTVERVVDPLGLVAKGSVWYLAAGVDGEVRSYRVSRIRGARMKDEACARPEGFDLARYWEQSTTRFKASLPRYAATVRVSPEIFPRLGFAGRFARIEKTHEPDAEGWIRVEMRFDVEDIACEYVLSFGPQIEVIEPQGLREKVVAMARSVVEFYEQHRGKKKRAADRS
jgi:predicted DNA-binding transcriptional regulator YafY